MARFDARLFPAGKSLSPADLRFENQMQIRGNHIAIGQHRLARQNRKRRHQGSLSSAAFAADDNEFGHTRLDFGPLARRPK